MTNQIPGERTVVIHTPADARFRTTHEKAVHLEIAKRIAALKGSFFGGELDRARPCRSRPYLVPTDTIVGIDHAHGLGIFSEQDLFGGVVPHAFVGTKAISHGLIEENATAPTGWSHDFAKIVHDIVPRGYTAFSLSDARLAARRLLHEGPVRVKPVKATGGVSLSSKMIATSIRPWSKSITRRSHSPALCSKKTLAIPIPTASGKFGSTNLVASYYGAQNLVRDNFGRTAYGGSNLTVVRGELDSLMTLDGLSDDERVAIAQAQRYDAAAMRCFSDMIVSRRNSDRNLRNLRQGTTLLRCPRTVVADRLRETPAEITALEALQANPGLKTVRVSSVEAYGTDPSKQPTPSSISRASMNSLVQWSNMRT